MNMSTFDRDTSNTNTNNLNSNQKSSVRSNPYRRPIQIEQSRLFDPSNVDLKPFSPPGINIYSKPPNPREFDSFGRQRYDVSPLSKQH
mmetsp:Transcript_42116/g.30873  ORF Transcript_42116/g.30873 Transcript_42116/m.30873 type:complete len:88 (+) Transcript_42116:617-880(+)